MKIRRNSLNTTHSVQQNTPASVSSTEKMAETAPTEGIDRTDRFEVGNSDPDQQRDKEPEEADELLQESMEDPVLFQELARSTLIGNEELSASIETTWNGVATLLDTDRE